MSPINGVKDLPRTRYIIQNESTTMRASQWENHNESITMRVSQSEYQIPSRTAGQEAYWAICEWTAGQTDANESLLCHHEAHQKSAWLASKWPAASSGNRCSSRATRCKPWLDVLRILNKLVLSRPINQLFPVFVVCMFVCFFTLCNM